MFQHALLTPCDTVLEHMVGGELKWRSGPPDVPDLPIIRVSRACSVFRDTLLGLEYCRCWSLEAAPLANNLPLAHRLVAANIQYITRALFIATSSPPIYCSIKMATSRYPTLGPPISHMRSTCLNLLRTNCHQERWSPTHPTPSRLESF